MHVQIAKARTTASIVSFSNLCILLSFFFYSFARGQKHCFHCDHRAIGIYSLLFPPLTRHIHSTGRRSNGATSNYPSLHFYDAWLILPALPFRRSSNRRESIHWKKRRIKKKPTTTTTSTVFMQWPRPTTTYCLLLSPMYGFFPPAISRLLVSFLSVSISRLPNYHCIDGWPIDVRNNEGRRILDIENVLLVSSLEERLVRIADARELALRGEFLSLTTLIRTARWMRGICIYEEYTYIYTCGISVNVGCINEELRLDDGLSCELIIDFVSEIEGRNEQQRNADKL